MTNLVSSFFGETTTMVRTRLPRRNFCIRLRHNALSALEKFRINLYRRKFRRYAMAAVFLTHTHPAWFPPCALSIFYRMQFRTISNKVWINPVPLEKRRKQFIDQWDDEILYQDFGFEKSQMHAILLVNKISLK